MENQRFSGRITGLSGGVYWVEGETEKIACRGCGKFRNENISPVVGDKALCLLERDGSGLIREILPRKNLFLRPKAANVDRLVIVMSAGKPEPDLLTVDKLILFCRRHDAEPILCINKKDVDPERARELAAQYDGTGLRLLVCSATEEGELDGFSDILKEGVSVLAGQSGVGKTTITSALVPDYEGRTGSLSKKVFRGKQTTRETSLLKTIYGGYLCDTPGFSLFDADPELAPEELQDYYEEFTPYRGQCRFHGCAHDREPDCAVKEAALAGRIGAERYERYREIYRLLLENQKKKYDNGGKKHD
ncbi:MAG: ribosome small subunit-dependent GTPase A [Eubacteriales bacterium]|nr:ribosome small subunit-dependent GTPase A [Eubacteriales bacterium]